MENQGPNLSGLDAVFRLKASVLQRLATIDRLRWEATLVDFVGALEDSPLTDRTALVVLLAELREELRLLLFDADSAQALPACESLTPAQAWAALPVSEIRARFKDDVLRVLLPSAPPKVVCSPFVERAKAIIEERYADRLTLERLAAAVGRSKTHLASVFRRELRTTPHAYLTHVRLRRAMALIREGKKVEAVSLLVGYRSKKNFYRHFKTHLGTTPLAYRAVIFQIAGGRTRPPNHGVGL